MQIQMCAHSRLRKTGGKENILRSRRPRLRLRLEGIRVPAAPAPLLTICVYL